MQPLADQTKLAHTELATETQTIEGRYNFQDRGCCPTKWIYVIENNSHSNNQMPHNRHNACKETRVSMTVVTHKYYSVNARHLMRPNKLIGYPGNKQKDQHNNNHQLRMELSTRNYLGKYVLLDFSQNSHWQGWEGGGVLFIRKNSIQILEITIPSSRCNMVSIQVVSKHTMC